MDLLPVSWRLVGVLRILLALTLSSGHDCGDGDEVEKVLLLMLVVVEAKTSF